MKLLIHKPPKITTTAIAEKAGVSPATVSRVVNQPEIVKIETYQKIISAMEELGCQIQYKSDPNLYPKAVSPIDHLAAKTALEPTQPMIHMQKGLIVINLPSLTNPFYGPIIKGIHTSVARHGYHLLISEGHLNYNTIDSFIQLLLDNHVRGLITFNHIEASVFEKLAKVTTVVSCCEYNRHVDAPFVTIDDVAAARNAVEHLLAQGRQRIALINGPTQYKYSRDRLEGYLQALKNAGITPDNNYIVHLPDIDSDLAISAATALLSLDNPPDAFFAISDVYAYAVLRSCHLLGKKIPEDVAVVGFDNLEQSKITIPSLSSVNQPRTQLGFMAAEILAETIMNPDIPVKKIVLDTELIVRESSVK
ncbi:MAG TPA: LacI family DNA-binding transcriptional regulator [Candidatus Egerieimonas intestinavium]|uniref:LacI family DNA-binding transcriptional regulator n=1 Tax=Candidatus Egerieimonas intestinavium TaxID=2840777 RepID=A0A9D1JH72_9FIRM|nr:LacI family DNA-binding transcriptional regulator [Candidatus Egerieimonas intestinavium]